MSSPHRQLFACPRHALSLAALCHDHWRQAWCPKQAYNPPPSLPPWCANAIVAQEAAAVV